MGSLTLPVKRNHRHAVTVAGSAQWKILTSAFDMTTLLLGRYPHSAFIKILKKCWQNKKENVKNVKT